MRIVIVAPGTREKTVTCDHRRHGSSATATCSCARPAEELYAGRGHELLLSAVRRLRASIGHEAVTTAFVSAGYGLVEGHEPLHPYPKSLEDLDAKARRAWHQRWGVAPKLSRVLEGADLTLLLLPDVALEMVVPCLPPDHAATKVFVVNRNESRQVANGPGVHMLIAGQDEALAMGVKPTDVRWYALERICTDLATGDLDLEAVAADPGVLATALAPRYPALPDRFCFARPAPRETPVRCAFYMPECDDRVDHGYDFGQDRFRPGRGNDLEDAFAHDPELYGDANYDGLLVSKNQVMERDYKRGYIERVGIHRYLRVPPDFPVMGDCGAFSYVGEAVPPYETGDILTYYQRLGFDRGVSIDHLIVPPVYTRRLERIYRLDGTYFELLPGGRDKLVEARRAEDAVAMREDLVTYLPREGLVVAERKRFVGADQVWTYPNALAACAHEPPFNASRLAKLRQSEYFVARVPDPMAGEARFFRTMAALVEDVDFTNAAFEPLPRGQYQALMKRKSNKELVGEVLRTAKHVFYPESEDVLVEGVTVDMGEIRRRYVITLWNGRRFLRAHARAAFGFTPVGAVQGWHGPLFHRAVRHFLRFGYQEIAIGGLAMASSEEILEVLRAIQPEVAREPRPGIHLFGVARLDQVPDYMALGVTSFDSTGPLRKAWLNPSANYFAPGGRAYAALRVPDPRTSPKAKQALAKGASRQRVDRLEQRALEALRAFDREETTLEEALAALMAYGDVWGADRKQEALFRKTLEDRPWKACPCDICRAIGIEVVIFRGNDRNRRRGFHNTWLFYQDFKHLRACQPPAPPLPGGQLAIEVV